MNNIYRSIAPCLDYVNQVSFYVLMAPNFSDSTFSDPTPTLKNRNLGPDTNFLFFKNQNF